MLSALLLGPDGGPAHDLRETLAEVPSLFLCHHSEAYPTQTELRALLDKFHPDLVLVDLADYSQARQTISLLSRLQPQMPLIGLHSYCDQELLLDLMQQGVRELWFPPLQSEQIHQAVERLLRQKTASATPPKPAGKLIAFLPSRGGCGATTVALNTAAALQKCCGPVLLADFDFHNSIVAFWLKLEPRFGIRDALHNCDRLEPSLWNNMVSTVRGLDILPAPHSELPQALAAAQTQAVLDFARQHYPFVLVDLPEAILTSCLDVLEHASNILIVVTPEMASLYLARRKAERLLDRGVSQAAIQVVLNRGSQLEVQAGEVQKFLQFPVVATFSNDYRAVKAAFTDGKLLPESSKLGAQFAAFARWIAGERESKEAAHSSWKIGQIFSPA